MANKRPDSKNSQRYKLEQRKQETEEKIRAKKNRDPNEPVSFSLDSPFIYL